MLSAEPVCSCACSCAHLARETAGAARTRLSLRPLFSKRDQIFCKPRAPCAARRWSHVLERRHCERSGDRPATPSTFLRRLPAHLQLAVALGAALAVVLRAALDGHRIVGHVLGDHRTRTDIGAIADL